MNIINFYFFILYLFYIKNGDPYNNANDNDIEYKQDDNDYDIYIYYKTTDNVDAVAYHGDDLILPVIKVNVQYKEP